MTAQHAYVDSLTGECLEPGCWLTATDEVHTGAHAARAALNGRHDSLALLTSAKLSLSAMASAASKLRERAVAARHTLTPPELRHGVPTYHLARHALSGPDSVALAVLEVRRRADTRLQRTPRPDYANGVN